MTKPHTALRRPFGTTPGGENVEALTLDNGVLSCEILTFGGTLRALRVPSRNGGELDVVLGYDELDSYRTQGGYLGALVGRYANRIAGGGFSLNGSHYALARNDGPNHLHGGERGFSHRVWQVEQLTGERAVLTLDSPDGEEGYPGHLQVRVTYQLQGSALSLHYQAQCDADTPCNLTNHAYFNLSGHSSGPVLDQEITLLASRYTPTGPTSIPTGELAQVAGTPMDLRTPTPIGSHVDDPFQQLVWARGYDHNWAVDGPQGLLRPAARAFSPASGVAMEVATTLPGVQFYTANYLSQGLRGKGGALYGPRHAFCLETQFYPDSPNQPSFPSSILPAGQQFDHTTRFAFSNEEPPCT